MKAFAEKVGSSAPMVLRWESGTSWPRPADLDSIARVFQLEPWQLLAPGLAGTATQDPKLRPALEAVCRALGYGVAVGRQRSGKG